METWVYTEKDGGWTKELGSSNSVDLPGGWEDGSGEVEAGYVLKAGEARQFSESSYQH